MKRHVFRIILGALAKVMTLTASRDKSFAKFMRQRNCIVQIKLKDNSIGRYFIFQGGRVKSKSGIHVKPDMALIFKDIDTALTFMKPPQNMLEIVHAAKNFKVGTTGEDALTVWFMYLLNRIQTSGQKAGMKMADGTHRYTTITNGGPLFVYVKEGKIVRTTPIEFDSDDAASWTIEARGKKFTPRRAAMVSPSALTMKSLVSSDKRLLHPMKRVDFDPNGARNPQNRGISGYERISWDEAFDIVANEMKRQKKEYGPGAMALYNSSHHQWGNVGYYISAMTRFGNLVGFTRVHQNPDSWEGWYWGAQHHFGNSMRIGVSSGYGTVEDCLKECELIVFWSGDPESVPGAYGGQEATQRRLWAKELGVEFVHIDPHFNATAQLLGGRWLPVRPGGDPAMAMAIMYVWLTEGLYDKEYVADRTTGFDEWRAYLLGESDGVPKTPEWQEEESGVKAHDIRALARKWGNKKTYLAPGSGGNGFGGACRNATGAQWARCMILMMAMQGWGKPGVNFGNLQIGTPLDFTFYFPGYAEGGISGDLQWSASSVNNYGRMPHVLSMNPVKQMVPRLGLPEAIIEGKTKGYIWDGISLEAQFSPFEYPMPGYSPIKMMYRYGGSTFGTIVNSNRFIEMYRHESLEMVVNQSIWFEGEAKFADIILPACTTFERWDIGEWANCGGYVHHNQQQLNHRVFAMQHKCIEPLGESKSDYDIFTGILNRMGLGALFTEGSSELDWCKRVFDSTDLPKKISWKEFLKKGYYVLPAEQEELREPVDFRWYAEDRLKDVPEPMPLPSQYSDTMAKGLQTSSGKIEFVPSSLKRGDPNNDERPVLNRYIPSWEGRASEIFDKYPLQLITTHSRYSFHTYNDGKKGVLNDLPEHRVEVDGYHYWVIRIHSDDAKARGIKHHDLVKVFNDRGVVICAADVSPLMLPGAVKSYQASAEFDLIEDGGQLVDRGGCMNVLTPDRRQSKGTDGMGANSCLVEITPWVPQPTVKAATAS